ncbi:hypothetical protein DH2020_005310 [Rehmannia glutinosa]|uniref:Uncharacterized protein n=1 Tax=Rehmannia glutinosa TaxID=99300 RepID=A0ABR0XGB2_REHGL
MEPYVTLFHWDLPSELENNDDFRDYAELCFEKFGDKVKFWFTLNEPTTYSVQGYEHCAFPPSEKPENHGSNRRRRSDSVDDKNNNNNNNIPKVINRYRGFRPMSSNSILRSNSNPADVYTVGRNMLLAHAAAVELYRTEFQEYQRGKIGITLVSHWFEPLTDTVADRKAAKRARDFMFLEPVLIGQYPENMLNYVPSENLKPFSRKESRLLKGSIDFLGLNYYTAHYAAHYPNPPDKMGYDDVQHVTLLREF